MTHNLHLTIRNRKRIYFDDDVKSVTSLNDKGIFDILPEHAHFISLIQKNISYHTLNGKKETIAITNGVMRVEDNNVHCYIDLIATLPAAKTPAK